MFYRVYLEEAENKISALEEEWKREGDDFEADFFYVFETEEEYDGTN
jgi:hypothetical protein